jgi:hypothetical protein
MPSSWPYRRALQRLDENSVTYITLAEDVDSLDLYDAILEIDADGAWRWKQMDLHSQREGGRTDAHWATSSGSCPERNLGQPHVEGGG